MKIKEEDKDLNYWKKNCEENLIHTPISVIRYIGELEKAVNNGVLDDVSNCEHDWNDFRPTLNIRQCKKCKNAELIE